MDINPTTAEDAAEIETLRSAGLSAPLATVLVEALREHGVAGRPLIVVDEVPEPALVQYPR